MSRMPDGGEREELLAQALATPGWYHTIDLGDGVASPGVVDLRSIAPRLLPARLEGLRALDVGTYDGFWAFELERRGAEVVATDVDAFLDSDWPEHTRRRIGSQFRDRSPGERFWLAHSLMGSEVRRVGTSIYDLSEHAIGGQVDYTVLGAVLLHLRDPVAGLERVHAVIRPGGRLLLIESLDLSMCLLRPRKASARLGALHTDFNWWMGNLACLRDWLALAGFQAPRRRTLFRIKAIQPMRHWCIALEATRP